MEWTISAFAFAAEAGTHLLTPEGWKAELALKPKISMGPKFAVEFGPWKQV